MNEAIQQLWEKERIEMDLPQFKPVTEAAPKLEAASRVREHLKAQQVDPPYDRQLVILPRGEEASNVPGVKKEEITTEGHAIEFSPANPADGNSFAANNCETLWVENPGDAEETLRIESADWQIPDSVRKLGPRTLQAIWFGSSLGWMQADGNIYVHASSGKVRLAVLRYAL